VHAIVNTAGPGCQANSGIVSALRNRWFAALPYRIDRRGTLRWERCRFCLASSLRAQRVSSPWSTPSASMPTAYSNSAPRQKQSQTMLSPDRNAAVQLLQALPPPPSLVAPGAHLLQGRAHSNSNYSALPKPQTALAVSPLFTAISAIGSTASHERLRAG
jgi:hypothetical protein